MLRITELRLPLDHAEDALRPAIAGAPGPAPTPSCGASPSSSAAYDARKKTAILLIYTVDCELPTARRGRGAARASPATRTCGPAPTRATASSATRRPTSTPPGGRGRWSSASAPAACSPRWCWRRWACARIVLERGKAVRERTKDTWGLWRQRRARPRIERAVRRGRRRHLLRRQAVEPDQGPAPPHAQGARPNSSRPARRRRSCYVAKPHIGTFRLVGMVEKMRAEIEALGGEIRFQQRVDRRADRGRASVRGVTLASGEQIAADHVVLALGHSARDTFAMLHAPRRVHGGQAVLDRLPHRASAER